MLYTSYRYIYSTRHTHLKLFESRCVRPRVDGKNTRRTCVIVIQCYQTTMSWMSNEVPLVNWTLFSVRKAPALSSDCVYTVHLFGNAIYRVKRFVFLTSNQSKQCWFLQVFRGRPAKTAAAQWRDVIPYGAGGSSETRRKVSLSIVTVAVFFFEYRKTIIVTHLIFSIFRASANTS